MYLYKLLKFVCLDLTAIHYRCLEWQQSFSPTRTILVPSIRAICWNYQPSRNLNCCWICEQLRKILHTVSIIIYGAGIKEAGVTLNENKCQFYLSQITFLGHVINQHGISPDPKKTTAIINITTQLLAVTELRQFMRMVNQTSKLSPNITHVSKPLRDLLSSKVAWTWAHLQDEAFHKLSALQEYWLWYIDVNAKAKVSATASAHSLEAVLLQEQQNTWQPVAFA